MTRQAYDHTLSRSKRLGYLELLAEIDEKSVSLKRISEQIVEAIGVLIEESAKREFQEIVARSNESRLAIYGDCV